MVISFPFFSLLVLLKDEPPDEWIGPVKVGSAHCDARLGNRDSVVFTSVLAASPGPGTEDMRSSTGWISLNLKKRNFYILYILLCQFLNMPNPSSVLELGHAVDFSLILLFTYYIYWLPMMCQVLQVLKAQQWTTIVVTCSLQAYSLMRKKNHY